MLMGEAMFQMLDIVRFVHHGLRMRNRAVERVCDVYRQLTSGVLDFREQWLPALTSVDAEALSKFNGHAI